jgi:hypothetical protein
LVISLISHRTTVNGLRVVSRLDVLVMMNFSSARKLTGEETKEELKCIRCGDRPNTVQIMLDPRTGKTLRMYECRCGERIWDD